MLLNNTLTVRIRWQPWAMRFIYKPSLHSYRIPGEGSYYLHFIEEGTAVEESGLRTTQLRVRSKPGWNPEAELVPQAAAPHWSQLVSISFAWEGCPSRPTPTWAQSGSAGLPSLRRSSSLPLQEAPIKSVGDTCGMQCEVLSVPGGKSLAQYSCPSLPNSS